MSDKQKTEAELLSELRKLRKRLPKLEAARTRRRKAKAEDAPQEVLRESERQYRSTLDAMGDAIHVVDRDLRIVLANKALREWVRELRLDKEMIGKTVFDVFPFLPQEIRKEYSRVLETGRVLVTEEVSTVGNRQILTETRKIPILEGRQTVGVVTVIRDITDRKEMEAEILRARKLESLGVLAGGIAHDFNNILTGVIGNISLAKVLADPKGKSSERLAEAERAAMRAKDLTRQLLTFAKGGMPVKRIVALGGEIIDAASLAVSGSRCRCDFSVPDGLWLVEADLGQIGQAVSNVVLNAAQAMPQGGVVRVSAENIALAPDGMTPLSAGDYVKITIADDGIGIPEKYIDNIFDPYFTTKQTGNGLGLTTCYSIIRNHGGHIAVKSAPGVGTTVDLYLPRVAKGLKPEPAPREKLIRGEGRVLIMDDEEAVRNVAGAMLVHLGFEVDFATDGDKAVAMYRKARDTDRPFDAVILDLTVPGGMGGLETVEELRAIDPGIKAIVSSGYSNGKVLSDHRRYGFKAAIVKPFDVAQVSGVLKKVLGVKK